MRKSSYLTLFVLAGVFLPAGHAQYIQQGGKLAGSGAVVAFAAQGSFVALSGTGDTAAVAGNSENAVWIFTRTNGAWSQQGAKISVTGCSGPASPGCPVALSEDGNTLIVGAPFDNSNVGSAWIFVRSNSGTWSQQGGKLSGNDSVGAAEQGYGVAVSADGNTALVGGALDASGAGATWVYTRNGNGVWSQQGPKLVGSGAAGPAWQGFSVALSADGGTALTGGPFDASFAGATWVFTRNASGVWSQQGPKLVGTGASGAAFQGQSVAISSGGSTAIVGGPQDNLNNRVSVGAAWVFKRGADGTWSQQGGKLVANDATSTQQQGQSVSISGDGATAVVGGPLDASNGAAWIYSRSNTGVWTQQDAKLTGTGAVGVAADQGQSVAISTDGSTIVVGGPGDNGDLGAAWVFGKAHFHLTAPATATTGVPVQFTVSLLDSNNANFTGYSGTVHYTSSDSAAVLPPDTTLASGGGSFNATFNSSGNQTITARDRARPSVTGSSAAITVGAVVSPATHFAVSTPPSAVAGAAFNFTVTALNAANQTVTDYAGTVHFTTTDAAASLPANAILTNGAATFGATLQSPGAQTISASDASNASITGTSNVVSVSAGIVPPTPVAVGPALGHTADAAFQFFFHDPRGVEDFGVLNILINNFLDGRHACYLAYSRPLNVLYLVDDNGALNPLMAASANSDGSLSNSQCTVSWGASFIALTAGTIDLALNITFKASFAGNKVIYMAARDVAENNSGWQALGVWHVPGANPSTTTSVLGMTAARGTGLGPAPFTFNFSDTSGAQDLGVVNILVNDSLDGRHACYLAYVQSSNVLYLVNDNGAALLPGQSLGASGTLANSQCTVAWGAGAVNAGGNNLTLNLSLAFNAGFGGNRVFYLAARDVNDGNNTDWQPMGTWTVQ